MLNRLISRVLALSDVFRRGGDSNGLPDWYASDNQFRSPAHLDRAHRPIVRLALRVLENRSGNVLDLGCGNGALLRTISLRNRAVNVFGVDIDPNRIDHARLLQPAFSNNFCSGDLFDNDWIWAEERRFALVLLSPIRLVDADPAAAARLKARLAQRCDHILLYKYGWKSGSLAELAKQTGINLVYSETRVGLAVVEIK